MLVLGGYLCRDYNWIKKCVGLVRDLPLSNIITISGYIKKSFEFPNKPMKYPYNFFIFIPFETINRSGHHTDLELNLAICMLMFYYEF